MINQHAKWLEATVRHIPWLKPLSRFLNLVLSSHVWRQDHNGLSHQDPSFVEHHAQQSFSNDHITNIYFPAGANLTFAIWRNATSTNCINAIFVVAAQRVTLDEAREGLQPVLRWKWRLREARRKEDIVLASCDVPTQGARLALDCSVTGLSRLASSTLSAQQGQNAFRERRGSPTGEFASSSGTRSQFSSHSTLTARRLIWNRKTTTTSTFTATRSRVPPQLLTTCCA